MKKLVHFFHSLVAQIRFNLYENRMNRRGLDWLGRPLLLVFLLSAFQLFLLPACQHAVPVRYLPPDVSPVATAVAKTQTAISATQTHLATAQTHLSEAQADASFLATNNWGTNFDAILPAVLRVKFDDLTNQLAFADLATLAAVTNATLAQTNAAQTVTNLVTYTAKVTNQTAVLNTTADKLSYTESKYDHAVALLWKWRLWCFGLLAVIVVYLDLKYGGPYLAKIAGAVIKTP